MLQCLSPGLRGLIQHLFILQSILFLNYQPSLDNSMGHGESDLPTCKPRPNQEGCSCTSALSRGCGNPKTQHIPRPHPLFPAPRAAELLTGAAPRASCPGSGRGPPDMGILGLLRGDSTLATRTTGHRDVCTKSPGAAPPSSRSEGIRFDPCQTRVRPPRSVSSRCRLTVPSAAGTLLAPGTVSQLPVLPHPAVTTGQSCPGCLQEQRGQT